MNILQYVPDHGLVVSGPIELDVSGVGLQMAETMQVEDKLSPVLAETESVLRFVVEFHADVDSSDFRQIVGQEGLLLREHPDLLDAHLLVEGSLEDARRLAAWDEVAYVFPASADLEQGLPLHACAGAVTAQGLVGQLVSKVGEGWDGPGRNAADLTYTIESLTEKLPREALMGEIRKALAEWSRVVRIHFTTGTQLQASGNLNILFAARGHGDPYAFDGRGRVLAHTFFPSPPNPEPIAGDLHFDEDEDWRIGNDTDAYSVILHELGHALGLGHSDKPGAVMYAYYRMAAGLTEEDIGAIQELYAAREDGPGPAPPAPQPPVQPPPPTPPAPKPPTNPPPPPPSSDRAAPSIKIHSPASTNVLTTATTLTLQGTAADNVGVKQVFWTTNAGKSGVAAGTAQWTISGVPLLIGTNYIVVRAVDEAGNTAWRSLVVRRQ